ncbi:uncharacterized protein LOC131875398 [Cryptomeria japonica]|uniref:uncharacterized protein LOC131875398 n=1 Tax=Cryptomeria japonica TaxID=3369 RepID=UPI0027DA5743|nr:uncharacterized protein LOC131875398 [Cryptomeria japonica]XP_059075536.1 uncharacterized protein LOC131875398 [Cryptomeria japonica]
MCDIQMCFPPSFFNSQEHYLVHLIEEIEQCGPIHIRTMWLVERYMKVLKKFVRQKARLEGSMVEGYMVFQAMVHLSEYLPQLHLEALRLWNYSKPKSFEGEKLEGQGTSKRIKDAKEWEALHLYVAYNSDFLLEWMEKYAEQNKLEDEKAWANIYNIHGQNTAQGLPTSHKRKWLERCSWNWLKTNIEHEATKERNRVTQQQLNFVKGSINGEVTYYKGMWNFGYHFRIKKVDEKRQTYDCGVSASFEVECCSHANDRQPIRSTLRYYGVLEDIIQLDFMSFKKVIFHVEWYKLIKVGEEKTIFMHSNGFHMINTSRFEATSEPYVFPNQCDQIFLIPNLEQPGWSFVIDYDPRGRRVTYVEDNEEDAEFPPDDENSVDGDDKIFIVNDAYDQDEYHMSLLKCWKDMSNHMSIKSMKMMNLLIFICL